MNARQPETPQGLEPQTPPIPGRKVAGWLIICFAVVPLAMAARGEGASYLWTGATMLAVGGALALLPARNGRP